jgi:MFS family permease
MEFLFYSVGTEPAVIGLLGSIFFVGWAAAAPFILRLVDIYGRKRVFVINMTMHGLFYLLIMLSKNLTLTIVLQFFFGIFSVGRGSISFLFLQELMHPKH